MRKIFLILALVVMMNNSNAALCETSGERLWNVIITKVEEKGIPLREAKDSVKVNLLANGYTGSQADEIIEKAEVGEEIHPFHEAEYDFYNMPASENGLENDLIVIHGKIIKYFSEGTKKNRSYFMILQQKDGREWLVCCAAKVQGTFLGKLWGAEPERHVFEGYEGIDVDIYCKYMGYSKAYNLPAVDIMSYGGMMDLTSNTFIMTMTAEREMGYDRIYGLDYLLGAERCKESTEPFNVR